jgi:hypothetical protein
MLLVVVTVAVKKVCPAAHWWYQHTGRHCAIDTPLYSFGTLPCAQYASMPNPTGQMVTLSSGSHALRSGLCSGLIPCVVFWDQTCHQHINLYECAARQARMLERGGGTKGSYRC